MITSANPFLIRSAKNTEIQHQDSGRWHFDVADNGLLEVDFLQFSESLDVEVLLIGVGAKCIVNCGYLLNKDSRIDINIHVTHKSKETTSIETIRGLVTDKSRASFQGIITIPYDSQKCDGRQNHRGIVLSDSATISSTPQLEIWADDVKCSHGSAVGPLDENQVFYLQTRGLNKSVARKLLLSSFLGDLMPTEFNPKIQEWMDKNV